MGQDRPNQDRDAREVVKVSEIETLLARIPGIQSARLMVNDWGAIEEIHVLATTERGPKQLVRDIESSLAARWGIKIDHKKISVAQLATADSAMPTVRLKLLGFSATSETRRATYRVSVRLGLEDEDAPCFEGGSEGRNLPSQHARIVAEAAVEAINQAVQHGYDFTVEEARLIGMVGRNVALVLLSHHGPKGLQQDLAGAAAAAGDPLEAVIKACLQATNRILERRVRRKHSQAAASDDDVAGDDRNVLADEGDAPEGEREATGEEP